MSITSKIKNIFINRNSKTKADYLRSKGMVIGENNRILCDASAFGTEPFLIKVGSGCLFSGGTSFITHDGAVMLINKMKDITDSEGKLVKMSPIIIGDNVYIGLRCIIMPGVRIGNNVIIGAGSIVTKDIPDNSVYAGNPARFICDLQTYAEKTIKSDKVWRNLDGTSPEEKRKFFESINILEVNK